MSSRVLLRWLATLLLGCSAATPIFPAREPLWRDPDRRPFAAQLGSYYSPHDWDRIEKTFVLPALDLLAVRTGGEAVNVNAWDEVPDSSWFENRIARFALLLDAVSLGGCQVPPPEGKGPWRIVSAKPDGATPGFVFEAPGGQRYLAKLDARSGGPRASIADVLGAALYHAAGYHVPCNSVVSFDASILTIADQARAEDARGEKVPLTAAHVEGLLARALREPDGRYRCALSQYLEGEPLGPWRYHGLRRGDRNDVIPHEDRRELRGSRLLAAWMDHVDQREGNTLAMWQETAPGRGYVMHHLLDFGDCFGSIWGGSAQAAWRRGHDYWLDPRSMLADWLTLGSRERPWDRARLGPTGTLLGFYDTEQFDPERWRPRYPNPAFSRMTERDGAWMARIIARIGPKHVARLLDRARAPAALREELLRSVLGRRQRILQRYLSRLSPLADPVLDTQSGRAWLCATDLAAQSGAAAPVAYAASGSWLERGAAALPLRVLDGAEVCARLPALGGSAVAPRYLIVELARASTLPGPAPIHFHLYGWPSGQWQLVGIERTQD